MIGRLRGLLIEKRPPELIIECGGVGYDVLAPLSTFAQLPETGKEVILHTHFVVREDAQLLFGFASREERELFRELIKVNGVGPKLALAVLSGMSGAEFLRAIHDGDIAMLQRLPGVGKKTAERLVVEMRDRLKEWGTPEMLLQPAKGGEPPAPSRARITSEAVSALVALGYKPQDASKAINAVDDGEHPAEQLIRLALRQMAK